MEALNLCIIILSVYYLWFSAYYN